MRPPRWPAAALASASVLYSSWLLGPVLNPRTSMFSGLASDLAASDQPWHAFFQWCDVVAGALVLVVALRMLGVRISYQRVFRMARRWHTLSRRERSGWIFLGLFGLATILDASVASLSCAPSVDANCPSPMAAGLARAAFDPHTLTSAVATVGGLGSSLFLALSTGARTARWWWGFGVTGFQVVANLGLLQELVRNGPAQGEWQRVQLLSLSAALLYAAVLTRLPPPAREVAVKLVRTARSARSVAAKRRLPKLAPGRSAPGKEAPGKSVPAASISGKPASGQPVSGKSVSGPSVSGTSPPPAPPTESPRSPNPARATGPSEATGPEAAARTAPFLSFPSIKDLWSWFDLRFATVRP